MAARIFFILAIAYSILVTVLSLIHLGTISIGDFNPTDKMMHLSAYFGMGFIWNFYLIFKKDEDFLKGFVLISTAIIVFGMLIEVLQGTLTDYRQPDWFDILANSTGVLIALIVFILFLSFFKQVKHKINLLL